MYIEDIIKRPQYFDIPSEYKTMEQVSDYFFNKVLDDYNIVGSEDGNRAITTINDSIFKVEFIDFKNNSTKYSMNLCLLVMENSERCAVSYTNLHRIKDDCCKEIPDKMDLDEAIETLQSIDFMEDIDIESRHKMADEVLISVISNYCPNSQKLINLFVGINKQY